MLNGKVALKERSNWNSDWSFVDGTSGLFMIILMTLRGFFFGDCWRLFDLLFFWGFPDYCYRILYGCLKVSLMVSQFTPSIYKSQFIAQSQNIKLYDATIDRKCIKIVHVMYETLPQLNMKFSLYFAHFCV
jgi:hypothetical protein